MRTVYALLRYLNDAKALARATEQGSPRPIVRRVGRRVYGKVTGRLAARIFG